MLCEVEVSSSLPGTQPDQYASESAISAALDALRLSRSVSAYFMIIVLAGAAFVPTNWPIWLTSRQVFLQDYRLAVAQLAAVGLASFAGFWKVRSLELSKRTVVCATLGVIALCYAGHYLILDGYDLTRDEQMVSFDAWIFRHSALVWPLPSAWQDDAQALNLMFMLPVEHPSAWVSAYLPGNAALHAAVGSLADPALTAPILTGLSVPLLWSIARKLWPSDSEAAAIPLILLLTSGQVLLSGMTTFAMAAHLCFNLAWLRLFLVDRRAADGAALALGWFATGLHQPLFHPMFVAPFLLLLLLERRWQRLAIFVVGYAAIGLFWLSWPGLMLAQVNPTGIIAATDGTDFGTRLLAVLATNTAHLPLLCANLLRFATWQNLALLPLLFATGAVIRKDRMAGALALGLILPIVVLTIILPWQGNGFGYRYVHPVLGNALLLAGYGWRRLAPLHDRLRPVFAAASIATLLILGPFWLALSHARYAPFARANSEIEASGADYLVLDRKRGVSYGSMVTNSPDLSNRPLRFAADKIRDPVAFARRICGDGKTVAMATNSFFHPGAAYFGVPPLDTADANLPALRAPYEAAGCRVVLLR
jgi:hypothetical protein